MFLAVGEQEKALEIMAENGWIDRFVQCILPTMCIGCDYCGTLQDSELGS